MAATEQHYLDLHLHSHFSRATSPALTPPELARWARRKGLSLLGAGDLTHPGWLAELAEHLTPGEDGFYTLRGEPDGTRFTPTGEISAIYKQDGRTRKIHLVVLAPDLAAAEKFSRALAARGNVTSDGRPILGLSARNLLEIALTCDPAMIVVPAHIWTPWFSLFGAQSGFDRLTDCFGDLSGHITALETGLSSDPAMNRLVSALDGYALISSSDAHSPDKLGREATILNGPLTLDNLRAALGGGPSLGGTIEFFPEEGKYHLDGHADCGPALSPEESRALGGRCPVCGKPLTIGVLHRVLELADRTAPPEGRRPDHHLIPLAELLGEVLEVGPKSRRVMEGYERLLARFGSELGFLREAEEEEVAAAAGPLLARAVANMRAGRVTAESGFDGRYGCIAALTPAERDEFSGQQRLFDPPRAKTVSLPPAAAPRPAPRPRTAPPGPTRDDSTPDGLDGEQRAAATSPAARLVIVAGPGSGKTRVLVHRAAHLVREKIVRPDRLLLTTFTRKAAAALRPRLAAALPDRGEADAVRIATLHALAQELLGRERPGWRLAPDDFLDELLKKSAALAGLKPRAWALRLTLLKNDPARFSSRPEAAPEISRAHEYYQQELAGRQLWDFDDLILEARPQPAAAPPFDAVLVDEVQDLSPAQHDFLKRLAPPGVGLTAIGDPDQSIYAFRGADRDSMAGLDHQARLELSTNYRSTGVIVAAGEHFMAAVTARPRRRAARAAGPKIVRAVTAGPRAEAAYVAGRIAALLGVLNLGRAGAGRQDREAMAALGLADIAVLFRLRAQGELMGEALDELGLAWQLCGREPVTATDGLDFQADKISLLTMHAAKGLEFRVVFVIGLEEGLCPYAPPAPGQDFFADEAEERRLFYVAMTRARERLYLCRAAGRTLYGQKLSGAASPYWTALPADLCREETVKTRRPRSKPAPGWFD